MVDIITPSPIEQITRENGKMYQRFMNWTQDITNAVNFNTTAEGTGSPEGVLTANPNKFYRDMAGPNLYWKSTGTGNTGWLLVV